MALPPQYVGGLAQAAARKQISLIEQSKREYEKTGLVKERPKVSSAPTPRSSHAKKFESRNGYPISDLSKVKRDYPDTDVEGILSKGRAAYASSGSRPNVSPEAWAKARLASVLTGGNALKVDKDLVGEKSLRKIQEKK
jgi:hypothetical protein